MRMQGSFKLFPSKPCLVAPNDIHTTTNSCHILTESHREGQSTCNKSHSMTYTHSTNSSCDEKIKGDKDSGSPDKRHTTVEGNVAPPVAHQVELLTLTALAHASESQSW